MKLVWLLGLAACSDPRLCNGSQQLCDRSLVQIAIPTTHNAMSNQEEGWVAPNQRFGLVQQLDDGIRAMMLDIYRDEGALKLCHGVCWAGSLNLGHGLKTIADFLTQNPHEVLTLILESYVDSNDLRTAFSEAGLTDQLHQQDPSQAWPSLTEMIDAGRRLVVLTDRGADPSIGLLPVWEHAFETPFAAQSKDDLVCELGRGDAGNALFIFNHFLTAPLASEALAETINHNPFLLERSRDCQAARGQIPNFVTVDFYSIGDVIAVTSALNQAP